MEVSCRTSLPWTIGPIFDRTRVPAEGYSGGGPGGRGAIRITGPDGASRELADKSQVVLGAEERFTLQLPGGGGFYAPFERDPALVLDDVLDELVSLDAAREHYGVAIDPATMQVDSEATGQLRANR
jgi:N-methylhydantoinase B/oxoprolinase/acetone carboxylase alpha subunit